MALRNRLDNLRSWLSRAPVRGWRLRRHTCLNCGGRIAFCISTEPQNMRCLGCGLTGTATALLPVLDEHFRTRGADLPADRLAWEMSTYGATARFVKRFGVETVESEYFAGTASGKHVDGIRCEDVTGTSFADGQLDLITSNQVFEHVERDLDGYRECFRILKPEGALVFAVPLFSHPESKQIADTVGGEVVFRGKAEYHGSRTTGPNSVPTFWHFSRHDLLDRVRSAGFIAEWRKVAALENGSETTWVVYAVKPAPAGHPVGRACA